MAYLATIIFDYNSIGNLATGMRDFEIWPPNKSEYNT